MSPPTTASADPVFSSLRGGLPFKPGPLPAGLVGGQVGWLALPAAKVDLSHISSRKGFSGAGASKVEIDSTGFVIRLAQVRVPALVLAAQLGDLGSIT